MITLVDKGKLPIYPGRLKLIFTDNWPEVQNKFNIEDPHDCNAVCFHIGTNHYIAFEIGQITPGIIAHECLHCYSNICKTVHIWPTIDNDEPQAYYLTWLVNRVFETCKAEYWGKTTMQFYENWIKSNTTV